MKGPTTTEIALEVMLAEVEQIGHRLMLLTLAMSAFDPGAEALAAAATKVAEALGELHKAIDAAAAAQPL